MKLEQAQTFALQALTYIAGDDQALSGLLAQTGVGPEELRTSVNDPHMLAGVLDYVLSNEEFLVTMCAELDIPPEFPARARQALPGGAVWD